MNLAVIELTQEQRDIIQKINKAEAIYIVNTGREVIDAVYIPSEMYVKLLGKYRDNGDLMVLGMRAYPVTGDNIFFSGDHKVIGNDDQIKLQTKESK